MTTFTSPNWLIRYTAAAKPQTLEISGSEKPTREHAAQHLRSRLLPSPHLIPATPWGEQEPTVFHLRTLGIEITSVEAMPTFATIKGCVTYTAGDGVPIEIPQGRVEVDLSSPDSATLSWEAAKDVVGATAIPRTSFEEYVRDGKIVFEDGRVDGQAS